MFNEKYIVKNKRLNDFYKENARRKKQKEFWKEKNKINKQNYQRGKTQREYEDMKVKV